MTNSVCPPEPPPRKQKNNVNKTGAPEKKRP